MRSKSGIGLKGNIGARKGINMQVPSSNIAAGHSVPQREDVEGRRSIKLGLDSHQSRRSTGRDEANTEEPNGGWSVQIRKAGPVCRVDAK